MKLIERIKSIFLDFGSRQQEPSPKNVEESRELDPVEAHVICNLRVMNSPERGGLNYLLMHERAMGQEPKYRGLPASTAEFFYLPNTGEIIHFGHNPELDSMSMYSKGNIRVVASPSGNKTVEFYTSPRTDFCKQVLDAIVRRYNCSPISS